MNPEIFREYDIRGIADSELSSDVVRKIGSAFAGYIKKGPIAISGDIRISTERIRADLISSILDCRIDVIDLGVLPTSLFYFFVHQNNTPGGIQITASHNPKEYNGFKLCRGKDTLFGEEIREIGKIAEGKSKVKSQKLKVRGKISLFDVIPSYIKTIKEKIKFGKRRLKVVIDCGNGCAGMIAPKLLKDMGLEVIALFPEPDGNFPNHLADPVSPENLTYLIARVKKEGADLGIGYDGDVDRIGAVDEKGNIIFGDGLMVLFLREILPKYPNAPIPIEVKCSKILFDEVKRLGGNPFFYKTGHSLIKAKMKEINTPFAGEMSGHLFFADEYFGFDDGIYASLRLLRILSNTDKTLSELLKDLPKYPISPEIKITCPDNKKEGVVADISKYFKERYECIDIDGVRIIFEDGWALIRKSNTSPKIIIRFEARTEDRFNEIRNIVFKKLSEYPDIKI